MKKFVSLLVVAASITMGCSERDDEEVDIDRIVQLLNEEEPVEWHSPKEVEMISGSFSPEESGDHERSNLGAVR